MISKERIIISHFDAHGIATSTAFALVEGIPPCNILSEYPRTSPEQLPTFIDVMFPSLTQASEVIIFDIPINLKDPATYIKALERLANNVPVRFIDHHKTDLQFISQLSRIENLSITIFDNALNMALALTPPKTEIEKLALVGVVADRDPSIKNYVDERTLKELYEYACGLDILVRQNIRNAIDVCYRQDFDALRRIYLEEYPPQRLASNVLIVRRGTSTILVDLTSMNPQQYSMWTFKILEQIALRHNVDYVVAVAQAFDRQTRTYIPAVFVVKYWLSEVPSPRPRLQPYLGRQTIGHDDAFSVRAFDVEDARKVASTLFEELEYVRPKTTKLISEKVVAEAIDMDFKKIMTMLTRILEQQTKMYEEYLELKRRQVELLERIQERERTAGD